MPKPVKKAAKKTTKPPAKPVAKPTVKKPVAVPAKKSKPAPPPEPEEEEEEEELEEYEDEEEEGESETELSSDDAPEDEGKEEEEEEETPANKVVGTAKKTAENNTQCWDCGLWFPKEAITKCGLCNEWLSCPADVEAHPAWCKVEYSGKGKGKKARQKKEPGEKKSRKTKDPFAEEAEVSKEFLAKLEEVEFEGEEGTMRDQLDEHIYKYLIPGKGNKVDEDQAQLIRDKVNHHGLTGPSMLAVIRDLQKEVALRPGFYKVLVDMQAQFDEAQVVGEPAEG